MTEKKEPKHLNLKNYPNLKKFDEYYKDEKNIKRLNIFYKKPKIDSKKCQIDLDAFDKKYHLNKYSEPNPQSTKSPNQENNINKNIINNLGVSKKYDFSRISTEDLNYYLQLVNYYHEKVYGGNIFIKGVNGPIEKALDLLKQCQYNTRLALAKILFPVMDRMGGLEAFQDQSNISADILDTSSIKNLEIDKNINIKKEENNNRNNNEFVIKQKKLIKNQPLIYLTFALNDLIGADKNQKKLWLNHIEEQVKNKIDYKNLEILMEIAKKMRLDLPESIMKEIKSSEQLSKNIKKELDSRESDLDRLKLLYGIAQTQNVITEEFHNLKKIIEHGEAWINNVKNISDKVVEFKELESLNNEIKVLPFEIDEKLSSDLNERYTKAQEWLGKYNSLPKITKNKNFNNKYNEHKIESLDVLENMIKEANDEIKFTSNEVKLLIKNFNFLKETEKEINEILNDKNKNKKITKEMLKNFISKLNESKFIIELHDKLEEELNILEWRENLIEYINNSNNTNLMITELSEENINEKYIQEIFASNNIIVLKNKSFKFLIREAESKKLLSFPDVKQFLDNEKLITSWSEKVKPIFHLEKQKDDENKKINFEQFLKLYEEGTKFNIINEECEELLNKCKELKNLFDEIKISLNITNDKNNNNILDFTKLESFEEKIIIYNISCDEFDLVLNQLNQGKQWLESAKKFKEEYNKSQNNKFKFNYISNNDLTEIDLYTFITKRNENIKLIEKYLKENKTFYNDLLLLTNNIPPYFKNSVESTELSKYQYLAEVKMNNLNKPNNVNDILLTIENFQDICILKETLENYFNAYRIKTWNQALKLKLDISQAESLFKEGELLSKVSINEIIDEEIAENDILILSKKIKTTKEWINKSKNYLNKKEKTIEELMNLVNEIKNLPLASTTINELINFKNDIEQNINEIKELQNTKKDFNTIIKLYKNFNNNKFLDCPEQTFIKALYDFGTKWTENAKKIINSRQLCQLYFNNKIPKKDGTFVEDSQNIIDILSGQSNENTLIEPKFANDNNNKDDDININNNKDKNNNFLSKKRNNDNIDDLNKEEKEKEKEKNKNNIINNDINNNINNKEKEKNNNINNTINNNEISLDEESEEKDSINENNNNNSNNTSNIFDAFDPNIEYTQSEKVKKYYLNQPLQKYEASNLLSLLNNAFNLSQNNPNSQLQNPNHYTRSHNNNNYNITKEIIYTNYANSKTTEIITTYNQNNREENVTQEQIQKFISMNYYERYMFLKSHLIFHDDNPKFKYCICRQGDDRINYMINCESCEEWFHGKCLAMPKPVADNIEHYYCLCCCRKYDLPKENYHKQFFEIKRVSLNELVFMIDEGKKVNCIFEEMEILEDIKLRSEIWNKKFYQLLDKIVDIYKKNNNYLDKDTENQLEILYLESEAIQVSLSNFSHVINILKHNEWFKKVNKELNSNRKNLENIGNLIKQAYWVFNMNEKIERPKMEENYNNIVYQLAELKLGMLFELYEIYHPNITGDISPSIKEKNKKK